jgi:Flp pilus assembly protein TadD
LARKASGDLEGAIVDFDQALRIKPKLVGAYNNRGVARKGEGNIDGAPADFDQALRLDPRLAEAYNNVISDQIV